MQHGDGGAGVRRIIEAIDGDSESNRVERIRAFFAYLKAHRPKQWEVLKAIIRTKGNREAALLMLGINKKLYLQHIFLLVKLTLHRLCIWGYVTGVTRNHKSQMVRNLPEASMAQ